MAGRRTYTDSDRARIKVALEANNGSVKAAARETGYPVQTIRDMRMKWDREGIPSEVAEALPVARDEFVGNVERVRNKALDRLDRELDNPEAKVNVKDLATTVGILTDKARLVSGQATSRTESVQGLPSAKEVRDLFAGFAVGVLAAAQQTHEEIIDAEWTEQSSLLELLPAAE